MKFKLDENFGPTVHEVFQKRGLDCHTVVEEGLSGADDPAVLAAAVLDSFLTACESRLLRGKLWIVEPGRIREHQTQDESGSP